MGNVCQKNVGRRFLLKGEGSFMVLEVAGEAGQGGGKRKGREGKNQRKRKLIKVKG